MPTSDRSNKQVVTQAKRTLKTPHAQRGALGPAPAVNYYGRYELILAIRSYWPEFWKSLRDWRQREPRESLEEWLDQRWMQLSEAWIVEDVLVPTMESWTEGPESPNALLAPDFPWFTYKPHVAIPDFRPTFSNPRLLVESMPVELTKGHTPGDHVDALEEIAARTKTETADEFEQRMNKQFQAQLRRYRKSVESIFGERNSQTRKHATWTVMVLTGKSYREIADGGPEMRYYCDAEKAIYRAVKRFAKSIGLTMPGTR